MGWLNNESKLITLRLYNLIKNSIKKHTDTEKYFFIIDYSFIDWMPNILKLLFIQTWLMI